MTEEQKSWEHHWQDGIIAYVDKYKGMYPQFINKLALLIKQVRGPLDFFNDDELASALDAQWLPNDVTEDRIKEIAEENGMVAFSDYDYDSVADWLRKNSGYRVYSEYDYVQVSVSDLEDV